MKNSRASHLPPHEVPLPDVEVTAVRASRFPAASANDTAHDRYEPLSTLGVGGMGRVVLCRDHRIGRDAAIKRLHDALDASPAHRARFLREARIQGQLEHPCIVPVYEINPDNDDGAPPSFSMRYARGELLADIIERLRSDRGDAATRYSRRRLLTAFSSVCSAVQYAHARGVLHRDLKPENVMLGDFGEVYVIDWGIARPLDDGAPEIDAPLATEYGTEQGQVVGTPGFIAPEGWVGGALDARADVYALGAMLFEMLTYTPLHAGGSARELMCATFTTREVAPSKRNPALGIPPELDVICATATALEREHRYASVRALRDAVERFLDGDRDVALRREAAVASAVASDALADSALAPHGTDAQRRAALQGVGRTLALDPQSAAAMSTLVRLILAPPRTPPPEVGASVLADAQQRERDLARLGGRMYLSWFAVLPLLVLMGARDLGALLCISGVMLACAVASRAHAASERPTALGAYGLLALSTLAIASMGLLVSPLLFVPTALVVNTMVYLSQCQRMRRWAPIAAGAVGMFAPLALALLGAMPSNITFEHGALVIRSSMPGLGAGGVVALVAGAEAMVLGVAGVVFQRAGAAAQREIERLNLLAWNLRQIVPESAGRVVESYRAPPMHGD